MQCGLVRCSVYYVLFLLLVVMLQVLSMPDDGPPALNRTMLPFFNSTLYIGGCARGQSIGQYLPQLRINIRRLAQFWADYRICIYADDGAVEALSSFNETKLSIISESKHVDGGNPDHLRFRTGRLAKGRNACLNLVRGEVDKSATSWDNIMFVNIDLDDINGNPFHEDVLAHGLSAAVLPQWEVLSFNRDPYVDFWAVRYQGYDNNIMVDNSKQGWWRFTVHKEFGESVLDVSKLLLFPVFSAFGGMALYKLNFTRHCEFNGEFAWTDGPHSTYVEDCEHVGFQKCMTQRNAARVVILNENYESIKETFAPELLAEVGTWTRF